MFATTQDWHGPKHTQVILTHMQALNQMDNSTHKKLHETT